MIDEYKSIAINLESIFMRHRYFCAYFNPAQAYYPTSATFIFVLLFIFAFSIET
ncbi:hypothetical protein DFR44_13611 [Hydromonas duriensis]|uniref:Uncharacterized protein n=1 Tax=Hydromonas duriensis TaxID=1527608 RepID=A0A4R6Y5G6_9BURK|nr:hypothetical protein DFR44_13611 [Hydromonas duriensis]